MIQHLLFALSTIRNCNPNCGFKVGLFNLYSNVKRLTLRPHSATEGLSLVLKALKSKSDCFNIAPLTNESEIV